MLFIPVCFWIWGNFTKVISIRAIRHVSDFTFMLGATLAKLSTQADLFHEMTFITCLEGIFRIELNRLS